MLSCTAASASGKEACVVGGGFAGLAAAKVLTSNGVAVTLVQHRRGLGGRLCTRTAEVDGRMLTWDHGCQYLTDKGGPYSDLLLRLEAQGDIAPWEGAVGDADMLPDGRGDWNSLRAYAPSKRLLVGVPTMGSVGAALAAECGELLSLLTGTRATSLRRTPHGKWRLELQTRDPSQEEAVAAAQGKSFDMVVTAVSSAATTRLLGSSSPRVVAESSKINANICWALLLALEGPSGIPVDGALFNGFEPIAWAARNSSKPGRPDGPECWVVHAGPEWSNSRGTDMPKEEVAKELGEAFDAVAGLTRGTSSRSIYSEAYCWKKAYPLNPLDRGMGGFVLDDAQPGLVACGDWCWGPRAGDAYNSGAAAAEGLLNSL